MTSHPTTDALIALVEHDAANDERSLQVALGPSEIGNGCDRCLVLLLAGKKPTERGVPLMPWIGRAVHEKVEYLLLKELAKGSKRWVPEHTTHVGLLRGVMISGHCDVYDAEQETVVDLKVVGTTTLRKVKKPERVPITYRRQAHLYAKGLIASGSPVREVVIWFMPRNGWTLAESHVHVEDYDPALAQGALDRANMLAAGIDAFGLDEVLASTAPHTGDEFTCTGFPGGPAGVGSAIPVGPVSSISL